MLTLSVKQPHANRIVSGEKTVEYRRWAPLVYPGYIYIHAGYNTLPGSEHLERGAIIGSVHVDLIELVERYNPKTNTLEAWFAWHLSEPRRLSIPITCKAEARLFRHEPNA